MQPRSSIAALLFAVLLGTTAGAAAAQMRATVTGTVTDAASGEPLPGVHVIAASTTIGTVTDRDGRYVLAGIPRGHHRIFASMVGYEPATRDTLLNRRTPYVVDLELAEAVVPLAPVTVAAERDRRWRKRLRRFEQHFLGTSANADSTRLLNPEVLRFDAAWWGRLEARSAGPLVLENRALGYRIRYFLTEFETTGTRTKWDGEPLFEEMVPRDSAEANRWKANRARAYEGSLRHFLRSLYAGDTRAQGFTTALFRRTPFRPTDYETTPRRVDPVRLVSNPTDSVLTLRFRGRLEVVYRDEEAETAFADSRYRLRDRSSRTQASYLELEDGSALVDRTGEFVDAYSAVQYGYFAFERLADAVPREYGLRR